MRRRAFLAGGAILALMSRLAASQPPRRVAIVLAISPVTEMAGPDPVHPITRAIVHELRSLGYLEGQNLSLERRSAEGKPDRYRGIIAELVAGGTEVLVLAGERSLVRAAMQTAAKVPIVLINYPTPVEDGFAASLAHPGGNITGTTGGTGWENDVKRLALLKEALPAVTRVAYLAPRQFWGGAAALSVRRAAAPMGIELLPVEHVADARASFLAVVGGRPDALFVAPSAPAFAQRLELPRLALEARLPSSFGLRLHAEAGGLMSHGVDFAEFNRRVAHFVRRILEGADPASLPMEQPTKFELVVNLKTAKILGVAIARSVLLRADRLIE